MQSFQSICVEHDVTFENLVQVVKHLLYWGMGKIIYPIGPSSVYILTKQTPGILKDQKVVEVLTEKLPQNSGGEQE